MKEEQKTRSFILFQNKFLKEAGSSSFRDFVLQLTGIFEYTGFITCIDLSLEKLEYLRTATDKYGLLYSDAWYKTSCDFIETSLKKLKTKHLKQKKASITVGLPMWKDPVRLGNSDSKVLNNLERLIAGIDSDIDKRNK